jgi:hypothetical protein
MKYLFFFFFFFFFLDRKYLKSVNLVLDSHRENFNIVSVFGESVLYSNLHTQKFVLPIWKTYSKTNVTVYVAEIKFQADNTGTYCQDVIFCFNKGPAVRRQLCVDCVMKEDLYRLKAAQEYLLYLTQQSSHSKKTPILMFKSPFVQEREAREETLCQFYPKPEIDNFFLTHTTLKETGLDPKIYRRRLHELVGIEEMARREQIARYNEVTELRLSSNYIIASDMDGSTVAKYAAPGELFAQVSKMITVDSSKFILDIL